MTDDMIGSPFPGLKFIKKFSSRKNWVYLVERDGMPLVLKLYDNGRSAYEHSVLKICRREGIAVPEPLECGDQALLMEYVEGRLANDYLGEPGMWDVVLDIASWLARFHKTFQHGKQCLIKSDLNFKNFIVADRLYGLDFELARPGEPELDVGGAIAYLLSTDPMFTDEKYELSSAFIERYEKDASIRLQNIESSVASSLREAASFRPAQREVLLKKAEGIAASKPFRRG